MSESSRRWYRENKGRAASLTKAWAERNPERKAELNRNWIRNNRDRYNAAKYAYRDRLKKSVLAFYSADGEIKCVACGITDLDVLCLDHINDDGAAHRKALRIAGRGSGPGVRTYEAIQRENFPSGLQVLCANCNLKKEIQRKRDKRLRNSFYAERINASARIQAAPIPNPAPAGV